MDVEKSRGSLANKRKTGGGTIPAPTEAGAMWRNTVDGTVATEGIRGVPEADGGGDNI